MSQSVLDGVVAIEAKAARRVAEAKARAKGIHDQVEADLERLASTLDKEADEAITEHRRGLEAQKATALAGLDHQLAASLSALETVGAEQVEAAAAEVARLLEQGGDGD